jgi:hypothetical protein
MHNETKKEILDKILFVDTEFEDYSGNTDLVINRFMAGAYLDIIGDIPFLNKSRNLILKKTRLIMSSIISKNRVF